MGQEAQRNLSAVFRAPELMDLLIYLCLVADVIHLCAG